jgi:hypothetical protein
VNPDVFDAGPASIDAQPLRLPSRPLEGVTKVFTLGDREPTTGDTERASQRTGEFDLARCVEVPGFI